MKEFAARLKVALFADGADLKEMLQCYKEGWVKGFTTNPTLMNKAGIKDYEGFAREVLQTIKDLPVSFEVFSDEFPEMERQAHKILALGSNANVKIPITNTKGESSLPLIRRLLDEGHMVNVTAILSQGQIHGLREIVKPEHKVIVSIFAGRIADTGIDPVPIMKDAVSLYKEARDAQVLWASPREILNVYQADECGVQIITVPPSILSKLSLMGKDLEQYSLETVKMFYDDAVKSGFSF
ncbi:MAG: transaldolase [Bdellovibrionales bacterium]